jgi:5-hydroxyisourate hydrolase-like protein (transthyretin family)
MPSRLSNDTYKFSMKQAVIAYSLSKAEQVEISLYDMLGRTAMTLSRRQAAGSYSIDLKGSTLAAGQYVVRFKAGAFERQAFMLMTR